MRMPNLRTPYHLSHLSRGRTRYLGRGVPGLQVRGVVTRVYEPDSPPVGFETVDIAKGLVCEVLTYEPMFRTVLKNVPVTMGSAGLNDHEVWRPRAATVDLTGAPLVVSGEGTAGHVSKAHDMDGDHVLVGFVNNDLNQPVILRQIPHPRTNRTPSSSGTEYVYERYIRGVRWAVSSAGDVEMDVSLASDGSITPTGTEIPSATAGDVIVTLKTGRKVSLLASTASAPEPALRSTTFLTDLQTSLTEISGLLAGLGLATPNTATFLGKITTSLTPAAHPYRSLHLEID